MINQGLWLPLLTQPPLAPWIRKTTVTRECLNLVQKYLEKGAIVHSQRKICHTSKIFALPKAAGGHRLIFDLRPLNRHIRPLTTRFTGHQRLRQLLPKGAWMSCLDIQDAYLHIRMHPSTRKFLCFQANEQRLEFTCLPFGLNIAPLVFTSILRPIIGILRKEQINVLAYLDDLIVWDTTPEACGQAILRTASVLQEHGFLINREKSQPTPAQFKDWLGFRWNSIAPSATLTTNNRETLREHGLAILGQGEVTYREMESFMGRLAFAAQLLPRLRYLKRSLTQVIRTLPRSDTPGALPPELTSILKTLVGTDALREEGPLRPPPPDLTIWSDASLQGWGFHDTSGRTRRGEWNSRQATLPISALELLTIQLALDSDLPKPGQCVAVFTDNVSAYYTCRKQGSIRSQLMHKIYGKILGILQAKRLTLLPRRIPGIRNVLADALSRPGPVATEWEIDRRDFQRILRWAPLQVDLMATPFNTKLPTFLCPFPHPAAAGVDALATPWATWQRAYIFPPSILLDQLLPHIQAFQGTLVLVLDPRASATRRTQLQSWATDSLILSFPPTQTVGDRTHTAPWSRSAPWIALLFSAKPLKENLVRMSRKRSSTPSGPPHKSNKNTRGKRSNSGSGVFQRQHSLFPSSYNSSDGCEPQRT